jgi:hypothetical protein
VSIGAVTNLTFSLQRPTWSSPKGPKSMFDDDDNITIRPCTTQSGGKQHQDVSLSAESDSDDSGQLSAGSGPNRMPESPLQGQRKKTSKPLPVKSHRQKAYDFEVRKYTPLA